MATRNERIIGIMDATPPPLGEGCKNAWGSLIDRRGTERRQIYKRQVVTALREIIGSYNSQKIEPTKEVQLDFESVVYRWRTLADGDGGGWFIEAEEENGNYIFRMFHTITEEGGKKKRKIACLDYRSRSVSFAEQLSITENPENFMQDKRSWYYSADLQLEMAAVVACEFEGFLKRKFGVQV